MKKHTFRKLINDLHLWLGIGSGIILFIVCISGCILAFETELVLLFDKKDHYSKKEAKPIPFETLIRTLERNGAVVKEFIFYEEEKRNHQFILLNKEGLKSGKRKSLRGELVSVNPYTGEKIIAKNKAKNFLHVVEEVHRFLLLNKKVGRPIVGISTIIFVFMCFSGLILWFPKKLKKFKKWKVWKQGFTIKTKTNWKRVNYDIHNTLGFYALIPLLLMGLSGLLWSFTWYHDGLEKVLGDKLGKSRFDKTISLKETDSTQHKVATIDFSTLLKKTDSILPYKAKVTRVTLPLEVSKSIMIRTKSNGFLAYDAADKLQFNPYTNELISIALFENEVIGSKTASLIRGIHVGNFMGLITKIIYFICCLIATSLPVTGVIIWINKMKKIEKPLNKDF